MKKIIVLVLLVFSIGAFAQNKKISDLTLALSLDGTEDVPILQFGINKRVKISTLTSGAGITNSAANNELMKSNGTNAVSSSIFVTSDGRLYGTSLHNNSGSVTGTSNQYIASGTYTPTLTSISNFSTSVAQTWTWIRIGNVVTMAGDITILPTNTGSSASFNLSLPITSSFTTIYQAGGSGGTRSNSSAQIRSNNGASTILVLINATNNSSTEDMSLTVQYEIR